jgi:cardiolipin synthase
LIVYDRAFTAKVRRIQTGYEEKSTHLDQEELAKRPVLTRFKENVALLIGPLL